MSNKGVVLFVLSRFCEFFYIDKVDKGAPLRPQMYGKQPILIYMPVLLQVQKEIRIVGIVIVLCKKNSCGIQQSFVQQE